MLKVRLGFFFFKQKTGYEWRISDWSSDVCSSDLQAAQDRVADQGEEHRQRDWQQHRLRRPQGVADGERGQHHKRGGGARARRWGGGGGGGAVAGKGRFLGVQVGPPRTV